MNSAEIESKLRQIVVDTLDVEDESVVKREAHFVDDLYADSLDVVELVMECEMAFEMDIPNDEAEKLLTFGDACQYVQDKLSLVP